MSQAPKIPSLAPLEDPLRKYKEDGQPQSDGVPLSVEFASLNGEKRDFGVFSDLNAFKPMLQSFKDDSFRPKDDPMVLAEMDDLVARGKAVASSIYSYRSCTKALAKVQTTDDQQIDVYRATLDVLSPEIDRLRELQAFQAAGVEMVTETVKRMTQTAKKQAHGVSWTHLRGLLQLMDTLLLVDVLKNKKVVITNDFQWYKRAFHKVRLELSNGDELDNKNDSLQKFLQENWIITKTLMSRIAGLPQHLDIVHDLLLHCVTSLEAHSEYMAAMAAGRTSSPGFEWPSGFLLPGERHMLLRMLALTLAMLCPGEKEGESALKQKTKVKLDKHLKLFKRTPIIPLFGDVFFIPVQLLQLSPFFRKMAAEKKDLENVTVPADHDEKFLAELKRQYELIHHAARLQAAHDDFCARWVLALRPQDASPQPELSGVGDVASPSQAASVCALFLEGLGLLGDMWGRVMEQAAFRCWIQPPPASSSAVGQKELSPYEAVVRNYTKADNATLLVVLGLLKGLAGMLSRAQGPAESLIWQCVHAEVQNFAKNTLADAVRSATKNKRDVAGPLLALRALLADWAEEPKDAPKKSKDIKLVDIRPRKVPLSMSQLRCMQTLVEALLQTGDKKTGLFSKPDIKPDNIKNMRAFFDRTLLYPYVLNYHENLRAVSEVPWLWFREFYLDMNAGGAVQMSVQFPVTSSLPYLLLERAFESHDPALAAHMLLPFEVFNDAATAALTCMRQQFLYDEIETEVDLCFEVLGYKLSEEIFTHYKCRAALSLLDDDYKAAQAGRVKGLTLVPGRHEVLLRHRHVEILGRPINLTMVLGEHVGSHLKKNAQHLIERFEHGNLESILELEQLLGVLRRAHGMLKELFPSLDDFPRILEAAADVPADGGAERSFEQRVFEKVEMELLRTVIPEYLFQSSGAYFVPPPGLAGSFAREQPAQAQRVQIVPRYLFGSKPLDTAWADCADKRPGIGAHHVLAMISVMGYGRTAHLVESVLRHFEAQLSVDLPLYLRVLALPARLPLPPHERGVKGIIDDYKAALGGLFANVEPARVYHLFRQAGNCVAFLALLDRAVKQRELGVFLVAAPFLGVAPLASGTSSSLSSGTLSSPTSAAAAAAPASMAPQLSPPAPAGQGGLTQLLVRAQQGNTPGVNLGLLAGAAESAKVAEAIYGGCDPSAGFLQTALDFIGTWLRDLLQPWGVPGGDTNEGAAAALDLGSTAEFHRIWSAILATHCLLAPASPDSDTNANYSIYGDGFLLGGYTVSYLLRQQHRAELMDLAEHVLSVNEIYPPAPVALDKRGSAIGGAKDGGASPLEVQGFLRNALKLRDMRRRFNAFLYAHVAHPPAVADASLAGPGLTGADSVSDAFSFEHFASMLPVSA